MKFKAMVYDTTNGKPLVIEPRMIALKKNGQPNSLVAKNGMRYREFKLFNENDELLHQTSGAQI